MPLCKSGHLLRDQTFDFWFTSLSTFNNFATSSLSSSSQTIATFCYLISIHSWVFNRAQPCRSHLHEPQRFAMRHRRLRHLRHRRRHRHCERTIKNYDRIMTIVATLTNGDRNPNARKSKSIDAPATSSATSSATLSRFNGTIRRIACSHSHEMHLIMMIRNSNFV